MSMDQIPAKEFMRRLANIDKSLSDIAKSLGTLTKVVNRQFPQVKLVPERDLLPPEELYTPDVIPFPEEDEDDD